MVSISYDLVIRNGICCLPWGEYQTDIAIKNGKIASLSTPLDAVAAQVVNARGLHVLPGLIDAQVHLRDPGRPEIETIATGTRAAALGGLTCVFDMPNTTPAITDMGTIRWKQEYAVQESWTDFAFYVGATKTNIRELADFELQEGICAVKVFAGSSTGDLLVEDDGHLAQIMLTGRRRVAFHSEDEYRLRERKANYPDGMPYETHRFWRDEKCAIMSTRRLLKLSRQAKRCIHILHVSTEEEMDILADNRDLVTVEVLANHLTLAASECYERLGGMAVMNPPIRDIRHQRALWQAVNEGLVDVIASDHAPHSKDTKANPWPSCASGLTGVQTLLPIMLNHVNQGHLTLTRLVDLMASGPARVFGLARKGRLVKGYDADITIVDMKRLNTITNKWIVSPVGWTPWDGMRVQGWPVYTLLRGQPLLQDGELCPTPLGKLARFIY